MAPNSLAKPTVVRVECEPLQKEYNDHPVIRTDFVLQNIFAYLIKNSSKFEAITPANKDEQELLREFIIILDAFIFSNGESIRVLCAPLPLNIDTLGASLTGIFNELFVNGYNWSKVVAFFVFVGIFTQHLVENNISEDVVDVMYNCFCCLVKENLKPWVDHHGGWNGVLCLKREEKPVGWTKNLLRNTASVISTIAHITNFP